MGGIGLKHCATETTILPEVVFDHFHLSPFTGYQCGNFISELLGLKFISFFLFINSTPHILQ